MDNPHLHAYKPGRAMGERERQAVKPRVSVQETKESNLLAVKKYVGVVAVGETPSHTAEFTGESHRILNVYKLTHMRIST